MAFDAHYNLSILLRHLKKYPESIEELEKASLIVDNTGDPYIAKYMFEVMRTITEKYAAQSEAEDGTHPKMKKGFTPDELQKKEYQINEVCYMVGFSSPSYFTKCFQKQYGITPKQFMIQIKNEGTVADETKMEINPNQLIN